jgi:hypothetical protein
LLEIAAVIVQRRLYGYHFLVLVPPSIVLFSIWPYDRRMGPIIAGVAPLALLSLVYSIPIYREFRWEQTMPASRYILSHTEPDDAVWADPAGRLLLETGRRPGSRLQMTFYLVNDDDAPRRFTDVLIGDFEQRRPKYIVLPMDWTRQTRRAADETPGLIWRPQRRAAYLEACRRIELYIQAHYDLETSLDGKSMYRRMR